MLLRYFWVWCSGFATALGLFGVAKGDWVAVAVGFGGAVAAAVVVWRGLFGVGDEQPVHDTTRQFRNVRRGLRLVRGEGER